MKQTCKTIFIVVMAVVLMLGVFAACSPTPNDKQDKFTYATNLTDGISVDQAEYAFRVNVSYGKELCALNVTLNGEAVTPTEGTYTVRLREGKNVVQVTATCKNKEDVRTYHVTFQPSQIVVQCDVEQAKLTNGTISFSATATCGGKACDVKVTFDGKTLTEKGGKYTFRPKEGDNVVTVAATYGGKTETKTYTVAVRKDFAISCDVEAVPVKNDVIVFSATATLNGDACSVVVKHNDAKLTAREDGTYAAKLAVGENRFSVMARSGDFMETKTYAVNYKGFVVATDFVDQTTTYDTIRFQLSAKYGDDACDVSVTAENAMVGNPKAGQYVLYLPTSGTYNVVITARSGNATYQKTVVVKYVTDPPHFVNVSLVDGKTYKGDVCCFDLEVKDSLGGKLDDKDLAFFIDKGQTGNYVKLSNADISLVWSDLVKTSYRFDFTKGAFQGCLNQTFNFKIEANSVSGKAEKVFAMTYVGADSDGKIGQIVMSIEGFTIGCGYFMEPTAIDIYRGENLATVLTRTLEKCGWEYTHTGSVTNGFYLASIIGLNLDGNAIAPDLLAILKKNNVEIYDESILKNSEGKYELSEFKFTHGSGWMYSVNNVYPNYGFADHYPQDGEVVRLQFTVALGSDIGGGSSLGGGGDNYDVDFGDFTKIYGALVKIEVNEFYGKSADVYYDVLNTIAVWNADKTLLAEQLEKLQKEYF